MSYYKKAIQIDGKESARYYNFSLSKKLSSKRHLKKILIEKGFMPNVIADIACGGGGKCASC